ncbi:MAG: 16S rRNA (guanine(527)-N(7))-methyltransferase RsmG [Calditrichaeota bacterium]|nr:MAG: 16S rRNA (guanine(527)-N(7))-methyltransferase RsmG [Calditrichota bacterium]MBL1205461.1 16S rRNA (guanine(527)-N(7))-methyltransferase RsmG [Calditrichota bacterium]NOG45290.1 16S rRNA (guanine(527)-N(7))-methyltransferase RsmG [Calditrichota bacterium]
MFHVKQHNDLERFFEFLQKRLISLSSEQKEKLKIYLNRLITFSSSHRVVSRNDIDLIVEKHFLSSFCFVDQIKRSVSINDSILDLGSGAGFPGVPLSIFFSENKVVLVESIRKKALFLKKICKELELSCEVKNLRIEDFRKTNKDVFKFITARALASIDELIALSLSLMGNGELHTIKGFDYLNEFTKNENHIIMPTEFSNSWTDYSNYLTNKVYLKIRVK